MAKINRAQIGNTLFQIATFTGLIATVLFTIALFVFAAKESLPFLKSLHFNWTVFGISWHPSDGSFGFLPLILGSLLTAALSTAASIPFAYAIARSMALTTHPFFGNGLRVFIETIAGLPSVVVGLWGLTQVVPLLAKAQGAGVSLLAAIVVLILMVTPLMTVAFIAIFDEKIKQFEMTSLALGIRREVFFKEVIARTSFSTLMANTYLGMGRALGETMAVLLVCGNISQVPYSLFDSVRTLNTNIALELPYAADLHRSALFFGGFLLLTITSSLLYLSIRADRS